MRPLRFIRYWQTLGWLGVCLIVSGSLTPSPPEVMEFPGGDKVVHFSCYASIMLWFGFVYMQGRNYLRIGVGLIVMGVTLELIQGVIGYRSMEYFDMVSNALGVISGWLLARTRISTALIHLERVLQSHSKP